MCVSQRCAVCCVWLWSSLLCWRFPRVFCLPQFPHSVWDFTWQFKKLPFLLFSICSARLKEFVQTDSYHISAGVWPKCTQNTLWTVQRKILHCDKTRFDYECLARCLSFADRSRPESAGKLIRTEGKTSGTVTYRPLDWDDLSTWQWPITCIKTDARVTPNRKINVPAQSSVQLSICRRT